MYYKLYPKKEKTKKCKLCEQKICTNQIYCKECKKKKKAKFNKIQINGNNECVVCGVQKNIKNCYVNNNGKFSLYCKKCTSEKMRLSKLETKKYCVKYKGEKCQKCGYNKNYAALEFHHTDPAKKDFLISDVRVAKTKDKLHLELDKCLLLCANCHAETHHPDLETHLQTIS